MGIRIIFEYSMVNDMIFSTVTRKSRKVMTSLFIIQMVATRFSELIKYFSVLFEEKKPYKSAQLRRLLTILIRSKPQEGLIGKKSV